LIDLGAQSTMLAVQPASEERVIYSAADTGEAARRQPRLKNDKTRMGRDSATREAQEDDERERSPGGCCSCFRRRRKPEGDARDTRQRDAILSNSPGHDGWDGVVLLPALSGETAGRNTLVLDLDETLVHSSFEAPPPKPDGSPGFDFSVTVRIDGGEFVIYVCKRPFVNEFLRDVVQHWETIIFTASLSKYANLVMDVLEDQAGCRCHGRLFREHCSLVEGFYVKDLSRLGRDVAKTLIIDNSPNSFMFHSRNGIACYTWTFEAEDTELRDLLPFLGHSAQAVDCVEHMRETVLGSVAAQRDAPDAPSSSFILDEALFEYGVKAGLLCGGSGATPDSVQNGDTSSTVNLADI
jgi:RNA polymerase II subunit A small phosphatase-like protein